MDAELSPYGDGPVPPGAFAPRPGRPPLPTADELAEVWRRALALLVDTVIVGALTAVVLVALGLSFFGDGQSGTLEAVAATLVGLLVFVVFALLYAPVVMARTNGQTLGKLVAGCRVVRTDGKRVDVLWAAWREVVIKGLLFGVLASFTGGIAYLIDVLWPLWDGQKRALHDFIADSRVVKASTR